MPVPSCASPARLGLDFGGVLQPAKHEDTDADVATLPLFPGAVDSVHKLIQQLGPENVFIVSKAGGKTAASTLSCLEREDFFQLTGFLRENMRFTAKRNGSFGKWPVIAELGLTCMVDDNWALFCDPLVEELGLCNRGGAAAGGGGAVGTKSAGDEGEVECCVGGASGERTTSSSGGGGSQNPGEDLPGGEVVPARPADCDNNTSDTRPGPDAESGSSGSSGKQLDNNKSPFLHVFFGGGSSSGSVKLDRDSNDKKAARNDKKCPFACGKEAYYREYTFADLEAMRGDSLVCVSDWAELMQVLVERLEKDGRRRG